MNASKSAVGVQSLCNALQVMGERLTHLYLAHNRLAGIPQVVNILSVNFCHFAVFHKSFQNTLVSDSRPKLAIIGFIQRQHSGDFTWYFAHRKIATRLPQTQSFTYNQFTHNIV